MLSARGYTRPDKLDAPMELHEIKEEVSAFNDIAISAGTLPILNAFYNWSKLRKRPTWDIYLVNILTIIRNCIGFKDLFDREKVARQAIADMEVLTKYISSYTSIDRMDPVEPKLIFYYPEYRVPEIYLRPPSKSRDELSFYHKQFSKHVTPTDTYFESLKVMTVLVGKRYLPHIDLDLFLSKLDHKYKYKRVCLISGVPLDYHFYKFVPNFHLIRSYTGEVMTKDKFSDMVFKYPVPFNAHTHLLFGDNKMIRSPITPAKKRMVVELAEKKKWKFQPEYVIAKDIQEMKLVDPGYFKGIKI